MKSPEISDKSRWFEILAVLTTAIGKFISMDFLEWRLAYILVVILFWGFFIRARLRGNPTLLKHWGFRVDNFKASLKMVIHLPTPWLVIGTFILSLVYNYIFLRIPNIYSLGVFHGWMAALFFYTVVDKDPFNQVFGFLFK